MNIQDLNLFRYSSEYLLTNAINTNKKILIWYHHFGGLGHGVRVFSLCKALKELDSSIKIVVVNSGVPQPYLKIDNYAWVINLPYFKAKEGLFRGLKSKEDKNSIFKRREKILEEIVNKFNPSICIFEHFPFGREAFKKELLNFIHTLIRRKILIYSSVRDIITQKLDSQELTHILTLFRGVFIHSDKEMGFITAFKKPKILNKISIFTGRLLPYSKDQITQKEKINNFLKSLKNKKLVVVNVGGGIDGWNIIKKIIKMRRLDKIFRKTLFIISTGPSLEERYLHKIKKLIKSEKNIIIRDFIPNYIHLINCADLSISMGGYNAINDALITKTPTIIIPREFEKEQVIRAHYFRKYVDIYRNSESIFNLIKKAKSHLENKKIKSCKEFDYFQGARKTARILWTILNLYYLKIRLHTFCDCNCSMCAWKKRNESLDFRVVKRIIDEAKILNIGILNFTGGEPTIYPQFPQILRYAKNRGHFISISTHGRLNKEKLNLICKYADFVDISLDSYKEDLHDSIRGRKGTFRKVINSIKILVNKNISLRINVTIRPDNYKNIYKIIPFLASYKVKYVDFHLVDTSENNLPELEFKPTEIREFFLEEVPAIVKESIRHKVECKIQPLIEGLSLFKDKKNFEIILNKKLYTQKIKELLKPQVYQKCILPQKRIRIHSNGEVSPCCSGFIDNLGNIYNESLVDILSSEKYFHLIESAYPGTGMCKECGKEYVKFLDWF